MADHRAPVSRQLFFLFYLSACKAARRLTLEGGPHMTDITATHGRGGFKFIYFIFSLHRDFDYLILKIKIKIH
jgi:hypothetical protein